MHKRERRFNVEKNLRNLLQARREELIAYLESVKEHFLLHVVKDVEVLEGVLKSGGPLNREGALLLAAKEGRLDAVELFLRWDFDPNERGKDGSTPLHVAKTGAVARALIRAGADLEATDAWGQTPLHVAVKEGKADVVEALLTAGASPWTRNAKGETPLDLSSGTVRVLLLGAMGLRVETKEALKTLMEGG